MLLQPQLFDTFAYVFKIIPVAVWACIRTKMPLEKKPGSTCKHCLFSALLGCEHQHQKVSATAFEQYLYHFGWVHHESYITVSHHHIDHHTWLIELFISHNPTNCRLNFHITLQSLHGVSGAMAPIALTAVRRIRWPLPEKVQPSWSSFLKLCRILVMI